MMKEIIPKCDKCLSKITDGKCSCDTWYDWQDYDKLPPFAKNIRIVLEEFANSRDITNSRIFSADHHSGNCLILFEGGYEDCQRVVKFIEQEIHKNV